MDLIVTAASGARGAAEIGGKKFSCQLGRGGVSAVKTEGDGITPVGRFLIRRLWHRQDRLSLPALGLEIRAIQPHDGWCDDPSSSDYNRAVRLPHPAAHEKLWREDHAYDVFLEIGYNDAPVKPHQGSAIFVHLAHEDNRPTAGCVAFSRADMMEILPLLDKTSAVVIKA
ncbi:MAG: L,D-transpeptidase [Dongiaceae bacterium]